MKERQRSKSLSSDLGFPPISPNDDRAGEELESDAYDRETRVERRRLGSHRARTDQLSRGSARDSELAILIMGVTGSGKSTFISRLTNDNVQIGHSLESCTTEVEGYTISNHRGQKIWLIDTPGFDDTQISDVDLLQKIASALDAMYTHHDIRFSGLIYMQRITDPRVAGSSLKSLRIFEKICGEENFPYITLVTTRWNLLSSPELGEKREQELSKTEQFLGRMIAGGAKFARDYGDHQSASAIIEDIMQENNRIVTALQREMSDVGKTLADTSIGIFLREGLERARKRFEIERDELEEALTEAKKDQDDDLASEISDQHREYEARLDKTIVDEKNLFVTKADLEILRAELSARRLQEVEDKRREVHDMAQQVATLQESLRQKDKLHAQELQSIRSKEARGTEDTLKHLSQRHQAESRALKEKLAMQKAHEIANRQALQNYAIIASWWEKLQYTFTTFSPPHRAQTLPLANVLPRLESAVKSRAQKIRAGKQSKLKKPKRKKEAHRERASTPDNLESTEYESESISDEDTYYPSQSLSMARDQSLAPNVYPARAVTHPGSSLPFELVTEPLGLPRRIPSPERPKYVRYVPSTSRYRSQ